MSKLFDKQESSFGELNKTAAAAAAEAAADLQLHKSAAQTATEALIGMGLHKSAAQTATEALVGMGLHKSAAQTATEALIGMGLHKSAAQTTTEALIGMGLHKSAVQTATEAAIGMGLHKLAVQTATEAVIGLGLHKSAVQTATEAMIGLKLSAAQQAAEAMAGLQLSHTENIYGQAHSIQFRLFEDLKVPNFGMNLAEIAKQAIAPLSQAYSSQLAMMAAEVTQTLPRTDLAALAAAALRDLNISTMGGNSIATAFAAFQAEQAKGFESLRLSFAGIAADALRQGLESLSERDEQAFTRFEQLIDEKIASLPCNQVTAESLLKFLLMLFIALGSLGADVSMLKLAIDSSTTQAEQQTEAINVLDRQHTEVMNVLERIAVSIGSLTPEQDQNVYYIAERKVALKLKPKNSSHTVTTIFPNQKTRLVQTSHQWIYVEYFDYLEGIPKYGWAAKKYLKRVT